MTKTFFYARVKIEDIDVSKTENIRFEDTAETIEIIRDVEKLEAVGPLNVETSLMAETMKTPGDINERIVAAASIPEALAPKTIMKHQLHAYCKLKG
jgi:hypothetical protein